MQSKQHKYNLHIAIYTCACLFNVLPLIVQTVIKTRVSFNEVISFHFKYQIIIVSVTGCS